MFNDSKFEINLANNLIIKLLNEIYYQFIQILQLFM